MQHTVTAAVQAHCALSTPLLCLHYEQEHLDLHVWLAYNEMNACTCIALCDCAEQHIDPTTGQASVRSTVEQMFTFIQTPVLRVV